MENLEYSRVKEMEGVKGPEGDCIDESTVLKVHLNIKSIVVFSASASLLLLLFRSPCTCTFIITRAATVALKSVTVLFSEFKLIRFYFCCRWFMSLFQWAGFVLYSYHVPCKLTCSHCRYKYNGNSNCLCSSRFIVYIRKNIFQSDKTLQFTFLVIQQKFK